MKIDPLFLAFGIIAICASLVLGFLAIRRRSPAGMIPVLLWAVFGGGLCVQAYAPHLKVENNKFIVPEKDPSGRYITDPVGMVGRERRMNVLAAILTTVSAVGLLIYYRNHLNPRRREASTHLQSEGGAANS
jgi:hypothetical protein